MTIEENLQKRVELNRKHSRLKEMYQQNTVLIKERKLALKEAGVPRTSDTELLKLQNRATLINAKIAKIKLDIAELPVMPQPQPKLKVRILPLPNEEMREGGMWKGCNLFELKLINLMIGEIGMKRFRELRRMASDDCDGKLARQEYTPEQPQEQPQEQPKPKGKFDGVDFDKMMRNNYNTFAGREI